MKVFNALQAVFLFAVFPFIINYLWGLETTLAKTGSIVACIAYSIGFVLITGCVVNAID